MPAPSNVAYAEGYLLYVANSMMAARRFDWKTLQVSGDPVMLGESVVGETAADAAVSLAHFSVAERARARSRGNAARADHSGKELAARSEVTQFSSAATPGSSMAARRGAHRSRFVT